MVHFVSPCTRHTFIFSFDMIPTYTPVLIIGFVRKNRSNTKTKTVRRIKFDRLLKLVVYVQQTIRIPVLGILN